MPRAINPTGWTRVVELPPGSASEEQVPRPLVQFTNPAGHSFSIHPSSGTLVRVVHSLPPRESGVSPKTVEWERCESIGEWLIEDDPAAKQLVLANASSPLRIEVAYAQYMVLRWVWGSREESFLEDFKRSYTFDAVSGRVWHYTRRGQSYIPQNEHEEEDTVNRRFYTYGLGETHGGLDKTGKRYTIDGRDSLAADPTATDPLYKLCPFYMRYDAKRHFAYGLYYNTLNPCVFDFGAEHDFSTGDFDSFSCEHGPLDYYLLLGDDEPGVQSAGTVPAILSQLARLVTPYARSPIGHPRDGWQVSPTLPTLAQLGYLASSLTLSERKDAQHAVIDYVDTTRAKGFPVDGMHLSSGYCQDETTQERHYFEWNRARYPDPQAMGTQLEQDRACQVIINVKPWLLESHPAHEDVAKHNAFILAADDATIDTRGQHGQSRTLHWSSSMGQTAKGSYFDFSSRQGCEAWTRLLVGGVLNNHITGVWIDNNEYSTLVDDGDVFAGEVCPWQAIDGNEGQTSRRLANWRSRTQAGTHGRAAQTMGMARCTYLALLSHKPECRPTVITRSAVPGMQAFASATWSGDNSTTWRSFRYGVKLTLSYGLSFGIGLYGQDIGGFAGDHSPSPELLLRWCQQAMWGTRFVVHSWKRISTTLWMYDDVERHGDIDGRAMRTALHAALAWRYRLIPTLYSIYVTDYFRRGWPVVRPLMWQHAQDTKTLTQDEQFLLGSHVLVAPVLHYGKRDVSFHLPRVVCSNPLTAPQDFEPCWWFDPRGQKWISPDERDVNGMVTLPAPIDQCPYLVRAGAILVLGPDLSSSSPATPARTVFDPSSQRTRRIVTLFPGPSEAFTSSPSASTGRFTLVEDDGLSNDATRKGAMTEIHIAFDVASDGGVECSVTVGALRGYAGQWHLTLQLPEGDERPLRIQEYSSGGGEGNESVDVKTASGENGQIDVFVEVRERRA